MPLFDRSLDLARGLYRVADRVRTRRELRARYGSKASLVYCDPLPGDDALSARWQRRSVQGARLGIVAVTYRQPEALALLMQSMVCQTRDDWEMLVIHDGADPETEAVVRRFSEAAPDRFAFLATERRYNDWGHSLRDIGLQRANPEFLLITNGDNYYVPRFVEIAFREVDRHGLDLAMWDMVHSHERPGGRRQPAYSFFETRPMPNHADIGCFMVRTSLAKAVGFTGRSFDADSVYLDALLAQAPSIKIGKIEKVLLVHN